MLTVAGNIKEFSNFRILKYFSNESGFLFHSDAPFFLVEPFPSAFSPQLSYPSQADVPRLRSAAAHQPMAGGPAAPTLLPSRPPAPSLPARAFLALWTQHRREKLLQKPWNATLRLYFKAALNCKQSAIDFKHHDFFCCCCFAYFNTWTMQFYLHLCKEQRKRPTIVNYFKHTSPFLCERGLPLAHTTPKLLLSLFRSHLTAELKRYSRC